MERILQVTSLYLLAWASQFVDCGSATGPRDRTPWNTTQQWGDGDRATSEGQ